MGLSELLIIYSLAASWCNKPYNASDGIMVVVQQKRVQECRTKLVACLDKANEDFKVKKCFEEIDK